MLLRRRVAVPAFVGVLGLVWLAAHALVHDLVAQRPATGHAAHDAALEAYLAYLPTSLALCLTLALAIAGGLSVGKRWVGMSGRSVWLFGLVPVLGFAAETLVELPARGPTAATGLVPALLVGLLLQLPFALAAVGIAGKIVWLVERLAWSLGNTTVVGRPVVVLGAPGWAAHGSLRALDRTGSRRSRAPPRALS